MQFCSDAVKQIALRSFAHRFGNGDQTSSASRITHYRYPVNLLETKNLVDLRKPIRMPHRLRWGGMSDLGVGSMPTPR